VVLSEQWILIRGNCQKALIYVGASKPQIPGIAAAKRAGLYTVVTDIDADAPGAAYADRHIKVSATDTKRLLVAAEDVAAQHELVGCYGVADYAFEAIGRINERFGLRGCSREVYRRAADKQISKSIWQKEGIPVADGCLIDPDRAPEEMMNEIEAKLSFPIVIKPLDSYNSQGITEVDAPNLSEFVAATSKAFQQSTNVMAEEFLTGKHINVDMLMLKSDSFPVTCTERLFWHKDNREVLISLQPADLSDSTEHSLYGLVAEAATVLGLIDGTITADIVLTGDGPRILEISPHFHSLAATSIRDGGRSIEAWFRSLRGEPVNRTLCEMSSISSACFTVKGMGVPVDVAFRSLPDGVQIVTEETRQLDKKMLMRLVWIKAESYEALRSCAVALVADFKEME